MTPIVFLSASIPLPHRHPKYFDSVDIVAVRDSIRALASIVLPTGQIVFGGHPAITPLMRLLANEMNINVREHIILYQSRFFEGNLPPDVAEFEEVRLIDAIKGNLDASLASMRTSMIKSHGFDAGVFIGGMEGIELEYQLFRETHPKKPAYLIASTGAAAKILFEKYCPEHRELLEDIRYLSLFRRLLHQNKQ